MRRVHGASPIEGQVWSDALVFGTLSPRHRSLPETFQLSSVYGLLISFGLSLWLKWKVHSTLSLDICYL